ncbi:hypothetical protein [Chitinophaga sancti]|uniref:hypothetical protein n=1 Tax=Chitinophaga sancti TaxID=1004 RepID=UPI003F7B2397
MTTVQQKIFPTGSRLPTEYFTGNAYLTMLLKNDKNNEFSIGCVTFEPGARTNWHIHPKGQVLIFIEGAPVSEEDYTGVNAN